jgi:hypothetical protein
MQISAYLPYLVVWREVKLVCSLVYHMYARLNVLPCLCSRLNVIIFVLVFAQTN